MMFEVVFDNPRPKIEVVEYDNELSLPMTEAVRKMGGIKGLFLPGVTVEEFKNGSLEAVEDLISSGEVYDVTLRTIPVMICSQIGSDNLGDWCRRIQMGMKMAMVQLPCWAKQEDE